MRPLTFDQAWIKDGRRLSGAFVFARKPASSDSNDDEDIPAYMKFLHATPQTKQPTTLQSYNRSLLHQAENDGARRTPARTATKHLARHQTHKDALLNYADQRQSAISKLRRTHSTSSSSSASSTAPYNIPSSSTAAKSSRKPFISNLTPAAATSKPAPHTGSRSVSSRPVWSSSSDDDSDIGDMNTALASAAARRRRERAGLYGTTTPAPPPHSAAALLAGSSFDHLRRQPPCSAASTVSSTSVSISAASVSAARARAAAAAAAANHRIASTSPIGTSIISPSIFKSPPNMTPMRSGGGPNRLDCGDSSHDDVEPDACPCEACAARIAVRRSATYQALAAGPPASQLYSAIRPVSSSGGGGDRIRTPSAHAPAHTPREALPSSRKHRQHIHRHQQEEEQRQWEGMDSEGIDRFPHVAALLSPSSGDNSPLHKTRDDDDDGRYGHVSYSLPYHQHQSPRDYRDLLFGPGGLKDSKGHLAVSPSRSLSKRRLQASGTRMVDFFMSEGGAAAAAARCSARTAATTARRRTAVDSDVGLDVSFEATLRPDVLTRSIAQHSRGWRAQAAVGLMKGPTSPDVDSGGGGNRRVRQEADFASETIVLMSDSSEDELVRRVASFARRGGLDGATAARGPRGQIARDQWAAEAAAAAARAAARAASRVRRTLAGTPGSLSRRMLQTNLLRPGASRSSSSVASTSKRSVISARSTISNHSGGIGGSRRSGGSGCLRMSEKGHLNNRAGGGGGGAGRWLMTEALRSPGYDDGYDGAHDGSSDAGGGLGATRSPSQRLSLSAVWGGGGGVGRQSSGRPPRSPPTGDTRRSAADLKRWIERYGGRMGVGAGSSHGGQRRVDGMGSSRRTLQF